MIELPGEYGLKSGEWEQKVYGLQVEWTPQLLQEQVKAGAVAGETYVLQYMEDVAQALKRLWRQAALPVIEEACQEIERVLTPQREDVEKELARTAELAEAREAIRSLDEALSLHEKTLRDRLPGEADWQHMRGARQRLLEEIVAEVLASRANPALNREDAAIQRGSDIQRPAVPKSGPSIARLPSLETLPTGAFQRDVPVASVAAVAPESRRLQEMAELLHQGAELLGDLPPFAAWSATLRERAERLAARRFTVALFGAFSAGKSSFANALLGEPLLPVSPNPTTAAINLIQASEEGHPHGTAGIQMKTPADMVRDVTGAFRVCGLYLEEETLAGKTAEEQEAALREGLAVLREGLAALERRQAPPDGELHLSFIRAAIRGWAEMAPLLGQSLEVDVSEFQNMVADETKACFVERVTLYYDCPLTVQGITLVDTPGADSVHARHTGVAFQFLKDADAVLYLTYYNHAFSKADREFLLQMGRVKSAFELDKMFFLLNAADLASSSEELLQVMEHLRHELGALGISRPNLFPVSSQLALLAVRRAHLQRAAAASGPGLVKRPESIQLRYRQLMERVRPLQDILTRDIFAGAVSSPVSDEAWRCSGMQQFEQTFYQFIFHQLADLALQNARAELLRGLEQLEQMIQWAQRDNQARASRAAEVQRVRQELLSAIEGLDAQAVFVAAENELQELLYYVRQRLFLRMPDFFQDAFSAIGEGSRPVREQLAQALESILRQTAMDLGQEIRATALRMERFVWKQVQKVQENIQERIALQDPHCRIALLPGSSLEIPEVPASLSLMLEEDWKPVLSIYKNAKSFYEQGGSARMREAVMKQLERPVQKYLEQMREQLGRYYGEWMRQLLDQVKQSACQDVNAYFSGLAEALADQGQLAVWQERREQLLAAIGASSAGKVV
ncbi:MAG: dynamin family protein [Alicyclobacillaceae bacterium]|nr:dynamin family protein [Alicyclobacillaceae bacterium]